MGPGDGLLGLESRPWAVAVAGTRKEGSWHHRQTGGLTLGCCLQLVPGRAGGRGEGGGKRRFPFLPQEWWSLASCRNYSSNAMWAGLTTAGIVRGIWLLLGTGHGGV